MLSDGVLNLFYFHTYCQTVVNNINRGTMYKILHLKLADMGREGGGGAIVWGVCLKK